MGRRTERVATSSKGGKKAEKVKVSSPLKVQTIVQVRSATAEASRVQTQKEELMAQQRSAKAEDILRADEKCFILQPTLFRGRACSYYVTPLNIQLVIASSICFIFVT